MLVTVQLRADAADALRKDPEGGLQDVPEVRTLTKSLGYCLKPMHEEGAPESLRVFFYVEVPDTEAADRVVSLLAGSAVVEAAYIKPMEEIP